ncbi:uncharacterized protein LOC120072115 [Benincasa hispida]|uniref:uncharacterized protein LOC120072115 n=1 Tax=Benincasa hispida TaxID=102211 RepID=UPI0019026A9A|nr:uncharacterized protein LOC120072115 [Benincasa hispida]
MARDIAFRGRLTKDPYKHLRYFLEICGTVKINGVTNDAIRLRLFPFSLKDRAKDWLETIPSESITTWEELAQAFLNKYFPPTKSSKLRKLDIGKLKPTKIFFQLANRSYAHPYGIVEDVLVKVDKFIFSVDFVVLNMEEDANIPISLGRPFSASRALIDVQDGMLTFRLNDTEVKFDQYKTLRHANIEVNDELHETSKCVNTSPSSSKCFMIVDASSKC